MLSNGEKQWSKGGAQVATQMANPPPSGAQTRAGFIKSAETGWQCLDKGRCACDTYHGTHVAHVTLTYPSRHDNRKHYSHLCNPGTTQVSEF